MAVVVARGTHEQRDYINQFWDESLETARMLATVLHIQLWEVRAIATSLGLKPVRGGVPSKHLGLPDEISVSEEPRMEMVSVRKCSRCGELKPPEDFKTDTASVCRSCRSTVASEAALVRHGHGGSPERPLVRPHVDDERMVDGRYEMLYSLLRDLPPDGSWSQEENTKWSAAFTAVYAYLVRVDEAD